MKKQIGLKVISGLLVLSLLMPSMVWAAKTDPEQETGAAWDQMAEQEEQAQDAETEALPEPGTEEDGEITENEASENASQTGGLLGEVTETPEAEVTTEAPQQTEQKVTSGITAYAAAVAAAGQWKDENGRLLYQNADGSYTRSDFQNIDGSWFYFDKSGWVVTGWQLINGKWYYFNTEGDAGTKGAMLTGWQTIDGKVYYLKQTGEKGMIGRMFTGLQNINKQTYYFSASGAMMTGLQKIGTKTYYFQKAGEAGSQGRMLVGWLTVGAATYYFKQTGEKGIKGQMFTGVQNISARTYYFSTSGALQTGWHQIGGRWFYFQQSGQAGTLGRMLTGWLRNGGKIYYLKQTGVKGEKGFMFTGWKTIGSYTYYFNSSGVLQTGWQKIGSKYFYFKATGDYGTLGRMFTGWVTIGGNKYFFKRTGAYGVKGVRFSGYQTIDGKKYYFDSNGVFKDIAVATDPINNKTYSVEPQYYTDPQIGSAANQVTQTEFLAAVLHTEAGDQGLAGQIMVGLVIYNRMMSSSFPSSMNVVVYQKTQFEVARNGALTKLLEGIRDNDEKALGKINNYNSMNAAKKATEIYNKFKDGAGKRIVPGVDALKDEDFNHLYFMTPAAFTRLELDEKACGTYKYGDHIFFREWVKQ